MKTLIIVAAAAATCFAVSGCATVSPDQLELEQARLEQARREVADSKQSDWRSAAGFLALGDEP